MNDGRFDRACIGHGRGSRHEQALENKTEERQERTVGRSLVLTQHSLAHSHHSDTRASNIRRNIHAHSQAAQPPARARRWMHLPRDADADIGRKQIDAHRGWPTHTVRLGMLVHARSRMFAAAHCDTCM